MCLDPLSLMAITAVVGGGISAMGSIKQGKAQAEQAERSAIAANKNADELEYQAEQRWRKMDYDVAATKINYERFRGKVRADAAKSGFDMRNFYDVLEDDARTAAMEVEAIKYQAGQEVRGLKYQAAGERWEAQDNITAAGGYKTASYISAASSVVGSINAVASSGVQFGSGWGQSADPSKANWNATIAYGQ